MYIVGIVTLIAAILMLAFGIRVIFSSVLRRNPSSLALLITVVVWLAAMAGTHLLPSESGRLSALCLAFAAIAWLAPFLVGLAMGVGGISPRLRRFILAGLFMLSLAATVLVIVTPFTGLIFQNPRFDMITGELYKSPGPFYLPLTFYAGVSAIWSMILILVRSRYLPVDERTRAKVLSAAFLPTTLIALAEAGGFRPLPGQSIIPFALAVSALVLGWGAVRSRLLSPLELVRENLVETMADPVLVTKDDETVLYANAQARKLAVDARLSNQLKLTRHFPFVGKPHERLLTGQETVIRLANVDWSIRSSFATSDRGKNAAILTVMHDVSRMTAQNTQLELLVHERTELLEQSNQRLAKENTLYQLAQDQLNGLVQEKEMLLQELHHRVKNNLQIIISLINLQSNRVKDGADVQSVCKAMTDRIRSISLVHERMYRLPFFDGLDFGDYMAEIINGVAALYDTTGTAPVLDIPRSQFRASIDFCVDFGLVINELTTNAYRHAILTQGGRLEVSVGLLHREVRLVMRDHGPGMSEIGSVRSASLGLNIIRSILAKHDAVLSCGLDGGAWVGVTIPLTHDGLSLINDYMEEA